MSNVHFISGLPRSGSTLLAGILRQNPQFHAAMTSPVGSLMNRMLQATSTDEEYSVFISSEQKRELLLSIFNTYYRKQLADKNVIFDTNRLWCSKLALIHDLFPEAKIICCVRNIAWVMDSVERLVRENVYDMTKMFSYRDASTVYSRTRALSSENGLVGFAYNALREAFYDTNASKLLLVDYELLTTDPKQTLSLIYQFIGEKYYNHDFDNVEYSEPEFDRRLNTPGLHTVKRKVEFRQRNTILPPDLFEQYSNLSFWQNPQKTLANVILRQQ